MAESAAQIQYRQEFIAGFEQNQSFLRNTVTTEAVIKGNQAVFLVADTNSATAVTRGLNGLIPGRADNLTQNTATLQEWHDKPVKTGFNIFISQGDQRRIMQQGCIAVMNRKIDADILAALETGTQDTGTAAKMDLALVMYAYTILGNNEVPMDGNITGLLTPGAYAYLMQTKEFTNVDYINNKPFSGMPTMFRWANVNWIVHPNLTGKATSAEKCIMFHKSAIGHAVDTAGVQAVVGYDEQDDYSWARCSVFMGSKLLQNEGVVIINHDGSGFAAQ